jgi:hypothetical protein
MEVLQKSGNLETMVGCYPCVTRVHQFFRKMADFCGFLAYDGMVHNRLQKPITPPARRKRGFGVRTCSKVRN